MPMEKTAKNKVTTCSLPPIMSLPKVGNCDKKLAPKSQNQEMPKIARNTIGFFRICPMISYVLIKILYCTTMPGSAGFVDGMYRLHAQPASATAITRPDIMAAPPVAKISSPPKIVPISMDTNVPASIRALPPINSSARNWSGRMPYLTGPKKADCVPMRKSTTIRKFALCRKNPTAAPTIRNISISLMDWISFALSHLSANCPAMAEKRKKGRMKIPAAAVTMICGLHAEFSATV